MNSQETRNVQLLYIVSLEPEDRVYCQHTGCTRTVYAKVHVVDIDGVIQFVGSTCFKRLFGHLALSPAFGGGNGNTLSHEEREQLVRNTDAFIQTIKSTHEAALATIRADDEARRQKEALAANALQQRLDRFLTDTPRPRHFLDRRRHIPSHRKLIPIFGCFKCSTTPGEPYEFKSSDRVCPRCGSTDNYTWRQE
jgi:rubrerythrin